MNDRVVPHNLDAERAVLGAALYSYHSASFVLEALRAEDFYKPAHAHVFAALSDLYEDGEAIEPIAVGDRLRSRGLLDAVGGTAELVGMLAEAPTTSAVPGLVDIVDRCAGQRRMLSAASQAVDALYSGQTDTAVELLDRALDSASRASDSRAFTDTPLDAILRGEAEPPRLITPWLYAGGLTVLQAEPSVGKSWLALWQAAQVMHSGGTVLYFDEEGGAELVADRIRTLGIAPELIAARFRFYPFEGRVWDAADVAALSGLIRRLGDDGHEVRLAVLDSLPDFLTAAGVDENSNTEVTAFVARVVGTFREHDVATLVLDHIAKPAAGKGNARSRYSRGAGAKLAKADATIYVETLVEFDRRSSGSLSVWRAKDRRGGLSLPRLGGRPRVVQVDVTSGGMVIAEVDDVDGERITRIAQHPTGTMEAVSIYASNHLNQGAQSQSTIVKALPGYRKDTIRRALEVLVEFGYLSIEPGIRGAKNYRFVRLYRQTDQLAEAEETPETQPLWDLSEPF